MENKNRRILFLTSWIACEWVFLYMAVWSFAFPSNLGDALCWTPMFLIVGIAGLLLGIAWRFGISGKYIKINWRPGQPTAMAVRLLLVFFVIITALPMSISIWGAVLTYEPRQSLINSNTTVIGAFLGAALVCLGGLICVRDR